MKKLNFGAISAGLDNLQSTMEQNHGIGWSELVDANAIDFAEKNTYAADDTDETIRELADQIEVAGLLSPLGVIKEGDGRYRLFSGERRYRAITTYLHWEKIPCQVFEGVSEDKAQLMLHMANASREYTPARRLELYEEYNALLRKMQENGEFSGGVQKGVAQLLGVSARQVRTYRTMVEQLTQQERQAVSSGEISFGQAKQIAIDRASTAETGTSSGLEQDTAETGTGSGLEQDTAGTGTGSGPKKGKRGGKAWDREKVSQIHLPDPADSDPHPRLLLEGEGVHAGQSFTALLPNGWHEITLEVTWDVEGPGCWYISTPGYQNVCPVGLFVKI